MHAPYLIDSIPIHIHANPEISSLYPGNCSYTKDFCIVPPSPTNPDLWVGYGSGGTSETEQWFNLRITADNPYGPFTLQKPIVLLDKDGNNFHGPQLCAPSVLFDEDEKVYVMTIQEACFEIRRDIHIFKSKDGEVFHHTGSLFSTDLSLPHQGAYDPEHLVIKRRDSKNKIIGQRHVCVYTGINEVSLGNIYLAHSTTTSWNGPWHFVGQVFSSDEAKDHHNQNHDSSREWCCEGEQLFELDEELVSSEVYKKYGSQPLVILNYVGFYPARYNDTDLEKGTRQHNAFAIALHKDFEALFEKRPDETWNTSIFTDLGPVHKYSSFKETGHGTLRKLPDGKLALYRQERNFNPVTKRSSPWRYALDIIDPDILYSTAIEKLNRQPLQEIETDISSRRQITVKLSSD